MTMRLTRFALPVVLLAAAPGAAQAQGLGDATLAAIPQYVSIKIGTGASAKTVSQLSIPLVAVVPIGSRFNIDVATAYANSDVSTNGKSVSSINGLTDTQVRANWTLGNDAAVITVGVNVPTGQYTIPVAATEAAGQIGNDFLIFPTSSYGAGLSTTGGLALARNLGSWNLGVAGSFRKSTAFDAFQASNGTTLETLRFTPADEVRARVGIDRNVGEGRLSLGVTYSSFGNDEFAGHSYATGDRFIGQASLYVPVNGADLYVSGWSLYRAKGEQLGAVSNPETVSDGSVALGLHVGNVLVEPNVEGRFWQVDGVKAGMLANVGGRVRFTAGSLTFLPGFTYQMGKLYDLSDSGINTDVSGWRTSLMIRLK
jgi:hypothetical protein